MSALPTRRDEAWRYADLQAVAKLWPLAAPEQLVLAEGEAATRHLVLDTDAGAADIRQITINLAKGAKFSFQLLVMGGHYGRVELDVTLHEGADFDLGAVILGNGDQTLEIITTVTHAEPNATSNQVIRAVLAERSTGTYLGKVAVARGAQKTDSAQSFKAMLIDRTATANAKPELEIFADDVKCAHGAAIGELDAMSLFYLESRGLTPADAKRLMLQAFVAGVFDGAAAEDVLQAAALQKLGEMVR
jgi:Fe-S cluster assembly protein SufD